MLDSKLHTAEAAESLKLVKVELEIPDPDPETGGKLIAAYSENKPDGDKGDEVEST
jgi:hypothetical protein